MSKETKQINFHDSGMKWVISPVDSGLEVEVVSAGFRKGPGFFPRHGHLGFNKQFQVFLKQEISQHIFAAPCVDREKITYAFSHEALNHMFALPRQSENPDVVDFVNTLFSACKNHFSYGAIKMGA